jgi:hypothetical protein
MGKRKENRGWGNKEGLKLQKQRRIEIAETKKD